MRFSQQRAHASSLVPPAADFVFQITEEAFARVDHKSLSQAIEAATELAFRQASDFFEEAMAEYVKMHQ